MTSLPNTPAAVTDEVYDRFVAEHAEQFTRYLRQLLNRTAEGRGGRVGVEDTLQDALVRIYQEWRDLSQLEEDERDRRLYRCLRSAAVDAVRREYGARERSAPRPQVIAYDFDGLDAHDEERPLRERELTAAVLGGMARNIAGDDASGVVLGRAVLVAGLGALTEHEAVAVIAVDHLGWDQRRLAEELGVGYSTLRETLYVARKLLSMTIRHAAGVEVSDQEQAQLAALRAGELRGAERRAVARHLGRCPSCQALDAQRQAFGHGAVQVLSPLPYVLGAHVLVRRSVIKTAPAAVGGGLFAQPGAAKVTAAVMSLLVAGGATAAVLAAVSDQGHHEHPAAVTTATPGYSPPGGMRRMEPPASAPAHRHRARRRAHHEATRSKRQTTTYQPPQRIQPQQQATAPSPPVAPARTQTGSSGADCEFFCG